MNKLPEGKQLLDLIAIGVSASVVTAWEQARRYNTPLIVWEDGKIVEIPPEELPLPSDHAGSRT